MSLSRASITDGSSTLEFITLKGVLQELSETVEDITRKGVDGQAYRIDAKRAEPCEFIGTRDCPDFDAAETDAVQAALMQGDLVTLLDDYGQTFNNVMVLKVEKVSIKPVVKAVGGLNSTPAALLTLRYRLQATE